MRLMIQLLLKERLKVSFAMKRPAIVCVVVAKDGFKCANAAPDGIPESPLIGDMTIPRKDGSSVGSP